MDIVSHSRIHIFYRANNNVFHRGANELRSLYCSGFCSLDVHQHLLVTYLFIPQQVSGKSN
ncbi:hypothetical protein AAFF_G00433760 [Aldrovandia affinis]|uniref:Uncharacterized protein n=1 Tax=Aldrovandia affinis TaxID=143900 RepID=A0AAD7R326_9TELE|nr:hypothetical protein AAFF_G00433760 [Aldrovandia affinis]